TTSSVAPVRPESAASSNAAGAAAKPVEKAEFAKPEPSRPETPPAAMPPQPPGFGTGNGILGVLPASSLPPSSSNQAMAYAEPAPAQAQSQPPTSASKPAVLHSGWIVQVGALDSEDEAQQRIEAARDKARGLLSKADPFTETVIAKGDHKLFRARFAGLDRDKAEAVCKALKRAEISCMTVRN
ncbi:MAG: SPOR domain-containing protein, partial [Bradyrhizobium sp.]|nr:SPOR domain-containing protein [Bradyrhizobium sp.]